MEKRIETSEGIVIVDSLLPSCIACIDNNGQNGYSRIICQFDNIEARIGLYKGKHGLCRFCDKSNITTSNFKKNMLYWHDSIPRLKAIREEVSRRTNEIEIRNISSFVHNLKNHTAQCEQLMYRLLPENKKFSTIRESLKIVAESILQNPDETALVLLKLNKNVNSLRSDFNVYERLKGSEFTPQIGRYRPYDVVKIVAHMFFGNLNDKCVYVEIGNYYGFATFDFEAVQSAIYYIFDNALKYTEPKSKITIDFNDDDNYCFVDIKMRSLYISEVDSSHLFEDGYSGEMARQENLNGIGLGMYMARMLINKSQGDICVTPGDRKKTSDKYAFNVFSIKFKKCK